MASTLRLDPSELDRLAEELFRAHAVQYQPVLNGLGQINSAISGVWNGPASAAFQTLHGDWIQTFERLGQDLPAIAMFLQAAADEYRKLDQQRRAALFETEWDRPGAGVGGSGQRMDERRASAGNSWSDSPVGAGEGPEVPRVKRGALPAVTAAQAQEMYDWVQGYSWDPANPNASFSWAYTPDGCYARAEVMNHIIQERYGVEPWKVWAFDPAQGLNPAGTYGGSDFGWGYHVAPMITIRDPNGQETPYVIDPSIASRPVTVREWAELMNARSGAYVDFTSPGEPPATSPTGPATASNYWPTSGAPVVYKEGVLVEYSEVLMENLNQCVANGEASPPIQFSSGRIVIVPADPDTCGYPAFPRPGR